MRLFLLILASFLPAAAWAWFFRQQDRYEKEPPGLLLRTFVGNDGSSSSNSVGGALSCSY